MSNAELTLQTLKISDVKNRLSSLVNDVCRMRTRVLVEKSGIPVAAIVSVEDFKRLTQMDERDRHAWEVLEAMRAPFRDVPPEELEREAAQAVAEARAERRAERERAKEAAARV
jgi:prevent-host-death family protein